MSVGPGFKKEKWEELKLVKELIAKKNGRGLWRDITKAAERIEPLLSWRAPGLEEFTDHDIGHSFRIIAQVGAILPEDHKLNELELSILIYSALYHDLGMWTKHREVLPALDDEAFINYCREDYEYKLELTRTMINDPEPQRQIMGKLRLARLVANWNRSRHPARIAEILREVVDDSLIVPQVMTQQFADCVAIVCEAHGWDIDALRTDSRLDCRYIGYLGDAKYDNINLRYLASLLRIGDLLDMDDKRISTLIWDYLDELSPEAEPHWRKARTLYFKQCTPDLIIIAGVFDFDELGPIAADAFTFAMSWVNFLTDETAFLNLICEEDSKHGQDTRVVIGKLRIDHSDLKAKGLIFNTNLDFELDKHRIIKLLGDEIYEDGYIFVRELLQNAIDATRLQMVRDYRGMSSPNRQEKFNGIELDERTPSFWPHEITGHNDYEIVVNTGSEALPGKGEGAEKLYSTLEVVDKGTGMTRDQIVNYFLQIGKSYYQSNEYKRLYRHTAMSRFGIGFISSLMVAERIEVVTRTHDAQEGIKLIIRRDSFVAPAVRASGAAPGTSVKLWIDTGLESWGKWDKLPLEFGRMGQIEEDLGIKQTTDRFVSSVMQWVVWPEMRVVINGKSWGPRNPMSIPQRKNHSTWVYKVISSEGTHIAIASLFMEYYIEGFPSWELALVWIRPMEFLSAGGVTLIQRHSYAMEKDLFIDLSEIQNDMVTASRRYRGSKIVVKAIEAIRRHSVREIGKCLKTSLPWDSMWQNCIQRYSQSGRLCLPVRRGKDISWEEWTSRRFRDEPCVLVPFFAVVDEHIEHRFPIVGIIRRYGYSNSSFLPRTTRVKAILLNNGMVGMSVRSDYFDKSEVVEGGYAFLNHHLALWSDKKERWEAVTGSFADRETVKEELRITSRERNWWETRGFDIENKSHWQRMIDTFGPPPRIKIPKRPIIIKLNDDQDKGGLTE